MTDPKSGCVCPYCEKELQQCCFEPVFCQPCGVKLVTCRKCRATYDQKLDRCPTCGDPR